jgi:hypothetical protein
MMDMDRRMMSKPSAREYDARLQKSGCVGMGCSNDQAQRKEGLRQIQTTSIPRTQTLRQRMRLWNRLFVGVGEMWTTETLEVGTERRGVAWHEIVGERSRSMWQKKRI